MVLGKVESGSARRGQQLLLMPNRRTVEVLQLWSDEDETNVITSGENVKVKLKGVEEEVSADLSAEGRCMHIPASFCSSGTFRTFGYKS